LDRAVDPAFDPLVSAPAQEPAALSGAAASVNPEIGGRFSAGDGRSLRNVFAASLGARYSTASVLNAITSQRRIRIVPSIPYGNHERQTLDVYSPETAVAAAVILFFYGGSWQSGNKALYTFLGAALARSGFIVIIPDYRVYPEIRYPGFLEDAAEALRWAKDNATHFAGDPAKLFVMGHSAGAYMAAMLALDARWLRTVNFTPGRDIRGLIGLSGPYDFLPIKDQTLQTIFGESDDATTQPINHVSGGAPPALLLTGSRDRTVEPGNSLRLAARLRAARDQATVRTYRWVGHLGIIGAFARPLRMLAPVLPDVGRFIVSVAGSETVSTEATLYASVPVAPEPTR
jgi:acetyl esterase/lipase